MAEMRSIEIDLDVNKRIELERKSFAETPNAVLRRLLGIDRGGVTPPVDERGGRSSWSGKGVVLPHGTELRMEYNGRQHSGRIENGVWLVEGMTFKSPSAAASGAARTKEGRRPSLDGWIYWQVKRPGDLQWIPIGELRR